MSCYYLLLLCQRCHHVETICRPNLLIGALCICPNLYQRCIIIKFDSIDSAPGFYYVFCTRFVSVKINKISICLEELFFLRWVLLRTYLLCVDPFHACSFFSSYFIWILYFQLNEYCLHGNICVFIGLKYFGGPQPPIIIMKILSNRNTWNLHGIFKYIFQQEAALHLLKRCPKSNKFCSRTISPRSDLQSEDIL